MSSAPRSPSSSLGLFAEVVRLQQAGRGAMLATPLAYRGSVPLTQSSRLLYRDDGSLQGTIGGGALEARVLDVAPKVMKEDRARVLDFDLGQAEAARSGMICGGRCSVLLEPIPPGRNEEAFAAAARAEAEGRPVALITLLSAEGPAKKFAWTREEGLVGSTGEVELDEALREAAQAALAEGTSRPLEDPVAHVDVILPQPPVFIFGAGHISLMLAHLADLVGFRVAVTDDREEFANRPRFPTAHQVLVATVEGAFESFGIGKDGYVVAVTRGHAMDEDVVAGALRTEARYIGMIGSRRKVAAVMDRLRERGFSEQDLARVQAPIGVDIKADTVEEIAVSILAQLIAVRRSGD